MSFEDDATFERALIESARKDTLPPDVDGAWARFAGALGVAAAGHGGVAAQPLASSAGASGALKWILLGALGGGALTAALTLGHRSPAPVGTVSPVETTLPAPGPVVAPTPAIAPNDTAMAAPPARVELREPRPLRDGARAPSTLAAEVARLDTARTVSAHGDYDEALRLIERYHRDFPRGALAADADVVAVEAAAAKGDGADVARRAALFFARYPNDPHAARVRALVTSAGAAR